MNSSICTREYEINSFLVNSQGRLGLYALLNLIQDVGWAHATTLGHGHLDTLGRNAIWVLTRQRTCMSDWPKWGSTIQIRTWLRPTNGAFVTRDYEISISDKVIGHGTSSFLLMNSETRKPIRENVGNLGFPVRTDGQAPFDAEKILTEAEGLETLAKFQVRNSDIDGNKHVNNTRYAQWVLDALPFESHSRFTLKEYEVTFLVETHLGDVVTIQRAAEEGSGAAYFHGYRESDSKIVFTARMRFEESQRTSE